jgi:hypothetical protein
LNQVLDEVKEENLKQLSLETKVNVLRNDFRLLTKISENELTLIENLKLFQKATHSPHDTTLMRYSIMQILFGIKLVEHVGKESYPFLFNNIPEDILNFEENFENHPLVSLVKSSQLSTDLLDKYRSMFRV